MVHDSDRAEILELFGRYADIADTKNFDELPPLVHTDPFTVDFHSINEMPPITASLADYANVLRAAFAPFVATHHVITGHVLDIMGDRAIAHAHVRAEHWVADQTNVGGSNRWLVVGFYDNEAVRTADGWRFNKVKLTATHQENAHLLTSIAT